MAGPVHNSRIEIMNDMGKTGWALKNKSGDQTDAWLKTSRCLHIEFSIEEGLSNSPVNIRDTGEYLLPRWFQNSISETCLLKISEEFDWVENKVSWLNIWVNDSFLILDFILLIDIPLLKFYYYQKF